MPITNTYPLIINPVVRRASDINNQRWIKRKKSWLDVDWEISSIFLEDSP